MILGYVKAFLIGAALCMIGQVLIDKTKLTPARILTLYVVAGVVLGSASTGRSPNGPARGRPCR